MNIIAVATITFSAFALVADAQSTIRGRVVADDTGDPIPNARVSLTTSTPGTPVVLADADGRFVLPVPAGRITVVASKSAYARAEITPATTTESIELRLRKGAVVSGRVVDEFGDPVASARVSVEREGEAPRNAGPPGPASVGTAAAVAVAETDDLGEYRLASLPAGSLLVAVTTVGSTMDSQIINGNQIIYTPGVYKTYYPGVDSVKEAQVLQLKAGEDRRGIDFNVPANRSDIGLDSIMRFGGMMVTGPLAERPGQAAAGAGASAVVRGRVTSVDGRGLAHALVRLAVTNGMPIPQTARADEDGAFEFKDLPAGRYVVMASKVGYSLDPALNTLPTEVGEGQTRERVDVRLARWGTLEGRVLDETGEPLQGASVQLLQVRYEAGRRRLVPAAGTTRTTDDLGRYRLYSIRPGQYIVSAAVGAVSTADLPGYTRSYFPGTSNAGQAQFVSIGLAQGLTGIDIALSRVRTARVMGKILAADGEPSMAGSLRLMPSRSSSSVTSVPVGGRITQNGTFEFPNVPPGQYIVQASRGRRTRSTEGEFGALPVSVDGADVTNLVLQMSPGSSISGRFTFDTPDRTKMPSPGAIELSPIPADFDQAPQAAFASAAIHDDWSFEMAGVSGPRRLQLVRAPAGWPLKEIRVNGIDATDRPLAFGRQNQSLSNVEVVVTSRISELAGTIADEHGSAVPAARLIVFATDRSRWYQASRFMRAATAGDDGAFSIAGLPFGSYYAAALASAPAGDEDGWQDPQVLESLVPRASSVTMRDGEKQTLSIRLPSR